MAALLSATTVLGGINSSAAETAPAHAAQRLDPTDFRTRFDWRNRYQVPQTGGFRDIATNRLDYAFSKTFALRCELPYVYSAPRTPGMEAESGLGDLSVRANFRVIRNAAFALVVGSELVLDTAESRQLGAGKYTLAPIAFLSLDAPQLHTTFFPTVQVFHSIGGDSRRPDLNYSTLKLFALTRWPASFYTGTEAVVFIDHQRNQRLGATLEVETGRFLSAHWAVWVRPGIATHGDDIPQVYNWNLEVGFRYLFD